MSLHKQKIRALAHQAHAPNLYCWTATALAQVSPLDLTQTQAGSAAPRARVAMLCLATWQPGVGCLRLRACAPARSGSAADWSQAIARDPMSTWSCHVGGCRCALPPPRMHQHRIGRRFLHGIARSYLLRIARLDQHRISSCFPVAGHAIWAYFLPYMHHFPSILDHFVPNFHLYNRPEILHHLERVCE